MDNAKFEACRVWELVPVKVDNFAAQSSSSCGSGPLPPYEGNVGDHCCNCSHITTEPGDDGFGTTVIEVTTVTTRKKYRVEDQ